MTVSIIKTESANEVYGIEQLRAIPETERTPAQREALLLHDRLAYDKQMVEVGIVSMCRDLKEIRDGKHYETLSFGDFGEYTEQMHGIGARQAYNYIRVYEKLGVEILNSNSKIGVTKLLELASLEFAKLYGAERDNAAILEIEVNLRDVVVPNAKDQLRTRRGKVLREVPQSELGEVTG